jgi:glycosyltransferase involved in cell wall biosynthesis
MTSEPSYYADSDRQAAKDRRYSVLIITYNEIDNIRRCLDSLDDCDDVVVLDSHSTDGTAEYVSTRAARLFQRTFDTFAAQRNWALDNVSFKHPWVLHLDADECITPALHSEIGDAVSRDEKSAYLVANKLMFMGRWIRHASMYPYYQARLLRRGESRFEQRGHGQTLGEATRGVGTLSEPYVHHNFSKGISDWITRHNRYSSAEASRIVCRNGSLGRAIREAFAGKTQQDRQQGRKQVADLLPARPLVRFAYLYFWKLGFLDGAAGFHYCCLMAIYDYFIRLKCRESHLRRHENP